MQVLYPRCAGLDVHKDSVVARIRCVSEPPHDEVRSFATTTSVLLELNEWLSAHGVTHVAMEATGVYWKPVWHLLEGDFAAWGVLPRALHSKQAAPVEADVARGSPPVVAADREQITQYPEVDSPHFFELSATN